MRVGFRVLGVGAVLAAALLLPDSAPAASYFQRDAGKTSIEVHLDQRRILYLHLDAPVHCNGQAGYVEQIADTRTPIRVRRTGAFAYVDLFRKGDEYGKAVVKGVIRHGRLEGEYRYVYSRGGDACWSGQSIQGTPQSPEGSAVAISVSRTKGLRFYKDRLSQASRNTSTYGPGSFPHVVYMWIGNGKAYGLTAIVSEKCVTHQAGFPPSTNFFDLVLSRSRPVRITPRTNKLHLHEVHRTGTGHGDREIWDLTADVNRDAVAGKLSHTYDYTYAGGPDTLHCQTGGSQGPDVVFDARHR